MHLVSCYIQLTCSHNSTAWYTVCSKINHYQCIVFFIYLSPTKEEVYAIAGDVCLSVCVQDYSKTRV